MGAGPATASSTALVTEVVQDGFVPGPARCEILPPDGEAEFVDFPSSASFTVPIGPRDIVTCALFNNIDYDPGINIVKEADPVLVRGDDGGTEVTYTGTVTNTGDVPLVLSDGGDDHCSDIEFIDGDTNGDGRLDLTETWTYQCTRTLQAGLTQDEILVDNTADVTGVDPNGEVVTDDDPASVEVLVPAINLEKVASATLVAPGTPVTYTFTVTNLGNDPLSAITLDGSTQSAIPDFVSGDTNGEHDPRPHGDVDLHLRRGHHRRRPDDQPGNRHRHADARPHVDDPADAEVDVVYEDMNLDKTPSSNVVFVGDEVTYTYVVSNPAADDLTPIPPTTRADLVTDDFCAPVTFVGGDTGDDEVLSQDEEWTYTCTTAITETTLNTATATMQGPLGPITREDPALVIPLPTGINIVKTASEDLVPVGTDVTYTYEVTNTGLVPLADVTTGVVDDFCSPVTFVDGDTDGDGLLDRRRAVHVHVHGDPHGGHHQHRSGDRNPGPRRCGRATR